MQTGASRSIAKNDLIDPFTARFVNIYLLAEFIKTNLFPTKRYNDQPGGREAVMHVVFTLQEQCCCSGVVLARMFTPLQ